MQVCVNTPVGMPNIDESCAAALGLLDNLSADPGRAEQEEQPVDAIWVLIRALSRRGCETELHAKRVGLYAGLVGEALGLDARTTRLLRYAAPLHDIGMVTLPDSILTRQGALDSEERHQMQRHTINGAEILSAGDSDLMRMARAIALTHHERYDARGYCQGLAGAEIPLSGRIAAVADVFDALTSARSYKQAYSMRETGDIIRASAGYQFDPNVVEAFMSVWDNVVSVRREFVEE